MTLRTLDGSAHFRIGARLPRLDLCLAGGRFGWAVTAATLTPPPLPAGGDTFLLGVLTKGARLGLRLRSLNPINFTPARSFNAGISASANRALASRRLLTLGLSSGDAAFTTSSHFVNGALTFATSPGVL